MIEGCRKASKKNMDNEAGYECDRHYGDNPWYVWISTLALGGNVTFHCFRLLDALQYDNNLDSPVLFWLPNFRGREPCWLLRLLLLFRPLSLRCLR